MGKDTAIVKFNYQPRMAIQTMDNLQAMLATCEQQLEAALPDTALISAHDVMTSVKIAASKNTAILRCTQESILRSALHAAKFGLDPSGALRSAYLVPYGQECQLIIGYGGFLDLAHRAAANTQIDVQLVYAGDQIDIQMGTAPTLIHKPDLNRRRDAKVIGCYALITPEVGPRKVEYMSDDEIMKVAARSRAFKQGPWQTDPGEMKRKTVLRRGVKWIPMSVVDASARRLLAAAEEHDNAQFIDAKVLTEDEVKGRSAEIMGKLDVDDDGDVDPPRAEDGQVIPEELR